MKYITEDGTELVSIKEKTVTHTCDSKYADGIYETEETEGAGTEIGIRQIKIKRVVNNGVCVYSITESTDEELISYQQKIIEESKNLNTTE